LTVTVTLAVISDFSVGVIAAGGAAGFVGSFGASLVHRLFTRRSDRRGVH
jgi:hypothetical protein